MNEFQKNYIALIRASLTEEIPAISHDFDYSRAFGLAQEFGLTSLLYRGARKDPAFASYPGKLAIVKQSCREIATNKSQMKIINSISQSFSAEGLDYCLLKGSEVKGLYPSPELRPMGDIDILIRKEEYEKIEKNMEKCGLAFWHETSHDYAWTSSDGTKIELHKSLFDPWDSEHWSYFDNIWDHVDAHYLKPEFSYLYQLVHFAKHTYGGSAPMKHIIDLYLYRKAHLELDMDYIERELETLQLTEFHRLILKVIDVWFYNGFSDEAADMLMDMAFYARERRNGEEKSVCGVNNVNIKSKFMIMISRLFLPRSKMALSFPILNKHPYLLPFCWIKRIVLFFTSRREYAIKGIKDVKALDFEEYTQYKKRIKMLGLEDRFTV